MGTGHAVKAALPATRSGSVVVVLYGDVPMVQSKTLKALSKIASQDCLAILTFHKDDPKGYGRIIRGSRNKVEGIVEEKELP
jgi:bifunctional UDP-N-acetylglucosamine pyrophosphorylase/glucosamine-1-phosphate N-acetyltransferase